MKEPENSKLLSPPGSDREVRGGHNEMRQELAQVIHNATRSQMIARIAARKYDAARFRTFSVGLIAESDRALAIVFFAFVDEQLRELLIEAMDLSNVGGEEVLFGSLGPLATSSSRLRLAAALRWLDPDVFRNLDLMRKIRNEFAHKSTAEGFGDRKIAGFLSSMIRIEEQFGKALTSPSVDLTKLDSRTVFHVRCITFTARMIAQLISAPIAANLGLHPMELFAVSNDHPEPIKSVMYAASDAILEILSRHREPSMKLSPDPQPTLI